MNTSGQTDDEEGTVEEPSRQNAAAQVCEESVMGKESSHIVGRIQKEAIRVYDSTNMGPKIGGGTGERVDPGT